MGVSEKPTRETDAARRGIFGEIHDQVPVDFARRLERERDKFKTLWQRDSHGLGVVIGQRDTARAVAEDNRARYVTAEAERDDLREALRDAMMDCDHMLLAASRHVSEWETNVLRMQDKLRARIGGTP